MYAWLERAIATPTRKVLFAAFVSTPSFLMFLWLYGMGLCDPAVRQTLHLPAALTCMAVLTLATLLNLILVARLWPQRNRPDPVPGATVLVIQVIGLSFAVLSMSLGVLTTGICVVLMGVLAVGIWLFDQRPMLMGYASVNAVIILHDLGVLLDWWPYAAALTPSTYQQGGTFWWFQLVRDMLFVVGWTTLIALMWILIGSLESLTEQLARLSNTDGLTGLANRRAFMEMLDAEVERQSRTRQPLCIVLIDADHFKRVNDEHGHAEGDKVLVDLARLLSEGVRIPTDLACRLGGEEFALILPNTRQEQAVALCMRLRENLSRRQFGSAGEPFQVTLSMGLAASASAGQSVAALIKQADEQLYRAKSTGRDRLCTPEAAGAAP